VPCEWCRGPASTELVKVSEPKVVRRGSNAGDVREHGVAIRACKDCAAMLNAQLDAKREAEEKAREEKAAARRKAAAERRKARRT
jgi:hypothetical protein